MNISNFLVVALLATAAGATELKQVRYNPVTGEPVKTDNSQPNVGKEKGETQESAKALYSSGSVAKPTSAIKLSGVTGEVKIKTAGGTMTVKAGEPVPEIPSGAEIIVVSGDANVAIGGTTVKAGAGDSFTVNTSGTGGASIAVTGGVIAVVDSTGKSVDLAKGEGTTVSLVAAPAPTTQTTQTTTEKKTETKTEDSIPADSSDSTSGTTSTTQSSPTQESSNTTCVNTVSPSAPCN